MRSDVKISLDKWAKERIIDLKTFYMTKLVSNYNTSPLRATDKFGRSIAYEITDKGLTIYTTVNYLSSMVEGDSPADARRVSFETLYRNLIDWATAKPVKLNSGQTVKTFAYFAARSIFAHGTTIYQLYGKRGKDTGLINETFSEAEIDKLFLEISDAYNQQLQSDVFSGLRNALSNSPQLTAFTFK